MSHCKKIRDELRQAKRDAKRYTRLTPGGRRRWMARYGDMPRTPMPDAVQALLRRIDQQMHAGDLFYDLSKPMVGPY